MKILLSLIVAAVSIFPVAGYCNNSKPKVVGFRGVEPFSFPSPGEDGILPLLCISYKDNEDITFNTLDSNGDQTTKTLNLADKIIDEPELTEFKQLCEELWVLSDYFAQSAALSGDFTYEAKGLCFGDYCYDPELNTARAQFIIESCYGEESNSTAAILRRLGKNVEQLLATIENEARKQTFDSTSNLAAQLAEAQNLTVNANRTICNDDGNDCSDNAADCLDIKTCFLDTFTTFDSAFGGALDDIDLEADVVNDQFLYTQCFSETTEELEEKKNQICATQVQLGCTPYTIVNGNNAVCPSEPFCPSNIAGFFTSYDPSYPDPVNDPSYGVSVASIQDLFFCKKDGAIDYSDRASADAVGIMLIVKITLQSLLVATEFIKDAMPHSFLYGYKVIPYIANSIALFAVETVIAQAENHDGNVQSAEIEALYENTRQLLDGSAAIYDEVVCRCTEQPRRGQGCDSVDNDCDKVVDECDEDKFPPKIDISGASLHCASGNGQSIWFTNNSDAIACVQEETSVEDDCDAEVNLQTLAVNGTCGNASITLNAEDRCGNEAVSAIVPVFVDLKDPVVTCTFGPNNEPLYTIPSTGAGILTDVVFNYTASDDCGFPLNVKVKVYANEIEDVHDQKMALFYRNGKPNDIAGLYLAAGVCTTNSTGQCIKDPSFDPRLYTAVVSATDAAGRSASTECQVLVKPRWPYRGNAEGSKQRFHLTSYASIFVG